MSFPKLWTQSMANASNVNAFISNALHLVQCEQIPHSTILCVSHHSECFAALHTYSFELTFVSSQNFSLVIW